MLKVDAQGWSHPKTFVLTTDDAEGELDAIREVLHNVGAIGSDDPMGDWFMETSAEMFAAGTEIPSDFDIDFLEMIGSEWPEIEDLVEHLRQDAVREAQEKAAE